MTKSAFVEVNITNPTKLAQDSQDTANNAIKGVTDLNDPNLMSVIEKQNNIGRFAGLTSQFSVLVQNAKDDGIDTTALTTAYNNLDRFMADILADPNHASDIDRARYKKYQDAYNEELAKLQNALQNNTNDKFTSAASALSQAASTANVAKSAADSTYAYANSEISVQSTATAKAQSKADDAFSKATTAIDTGNVTSQAVTALKGGSKLTIAELENGLATKVANSEYASYKIQTASQIGQLVTNGAFSAYQQTTADLIASKVATKDFSAYQDTTAKAISSKVESKDFNTYKTQTADLISQTVTGAISNISIGGRNIVLDSSNMGSFKIWQEDGNSKLSDDKKEITISTSHGGINIEKKNLSGHLPNKGDTIVISADVKGNSHIQFNYSNGNSFVGSGTNIAVTTEYKRYFTTFEWNPVNLGNPQFVIFALGSAEQYLTVKNVKVEIGNKATDWSPAPEDQATQSQFTQLSDDMNLRVTKGDLIDEINLKAGNTLISSSGQLTLSGKNINFDTDNPVIIPSANIDTLLVDKKLTAADISANTFTTNNGTFTVEKDGAITAKNMTLTGGTLTSPTINASKINSATINGTTINAGDIINNANNTAKFYSLTIGSNGLLHSYHIDDNFANSAKLYTGNLVISNRNMSANAGSNNFAGETAVLGGSYLTLSSGYTVGKDTDFTKTLISEGQPGTTKLILSSINGITLKGDDQKIHFHGMYSDSQPKGITFTPYGNINGDEGSTTGNWYVGYNLANMTAQFGIDNLSKNTIGLYRPTFVDEIGAMGNRLTSGRLLLHDVKGTAQMYLLNDGTPAVVSPTIYNRTYSSGSNMYVTSSGRVGRTTSASKYKLAIARSDDTLQADRLMTLNLASWNDKVATEKMAKSLSNGEIPVEPEINLKRHYGLIAEDLRDAGLDEFLITGDKGQIEGIEYDRLWTVLIPKIKQLNNRINELERKTL